MPNAIQLLKQDHRKVEQLFEQFEALQDGRVAAQVCQELSIHSQIEEEIVYPELERIDEAAARDAAHEHGEMKTLMTRIDHVVDGDIDQLFELMVQLKSVVARHVQDEEHEAFPKLQETISERLDELGRQLENRRQDLVGGAAGPGGLLDLTKEELYAKAQEAGIKGRSQMNKEELAQALSR